MLMEACGKPFSISLVTGCGRKLVFEGRDWAWLELPINKLFPTWIAANLGGQGCAKSTLTCGGPGEGGQHNGVEWLQLCKDCCVRNGLIW